MVKYLNETLSVGGGVITPTGANLDYSKRIQVFQGAYSNITINTQMFIYSKSSGFLGAPIDNITIQRQGGGGGVIYLCKADIAYISADIKSSTDTINTITFNTVGYTLAGDAKQLYSIFSYSGGGSGDSNIVTVDSSNTVIVSAISDTPRVYNTQIVLDITQSVDNEQWIIEYTPAYTSITATKS